MKRINLAIFRLMDYYVPQYRIWFFARRLFKMHNCFLYKLCPLAVNYWSQSVLRFWKVLTYERDQKVEQDYDQDKVLAKVDEPYWEFHGDADPGVWAWEFGPVFVGGNWWVSEAVSEGVEEVPPELG